jgi:triacylglycerol lipase
MRFIVALIIFSISFVANANSKECVVLLHGWARSNKCMKSIEEDLQKSGFHTINISYPSRKYTIDEIATEYIHPNINTKDCHKVHFIGHSMGGIVTRYYLSKYKIDKVDKVILIASPSKGSELVQKFQTTKWIANILGPGCLELSKDSPLLTSLTKPYYKVGVISANLSINPITSLFFLPGDDDGTVTVESTLIEDMSDQFTISSTHTMVLKNHNTLKQIKHFLKYGLFAKNN